MSKSNADESSLELPCASCGKVNRVNVAALKREGSFVCPSCGEEAWVDSAALQDQLNATEEAGTGN
jgi:predicted RNA-binding Zn-ribbon protein involved in translation (DUF1610 family)